MISILIPIYNYDIRPLVTTLVKQGELLDVSYEINCIDDGSEWHFRSRRLQVGQS